jgi:anti-sigma factor RsiW
MDEPPMSAPLHPWSCEQVRDRLEAYVDGDLEGAEAAEVRAHLERDGGCAACREQVALAARIRDALRAVPALACPDQLVERALARAAGRGAPAGAGPASPLAPPRAANDEPAASRGWWRGALVAAAAGLLLALGLLAFGALRSADRVPAGARAGAGVDEEIDAQELARATEEARLALAYVAAIGRRSALTLRDDVVGRDIVGPSARALQRALGPLTPDPDPAAPATHRRGDRP